MNSVMNKTWICKYIVLIWYSQSQIILQHPTNHYLKNSQSWMSFCPCSNQVKPIHLHPDTRHIMFAGAAKVLSEWYNFYTGPGSSNMDWSVSVPVNSLRPKRNGRYNADNIFKCIFLKENVWIPTKISLKFVLKGPINNIPPLVQIMAWRRPGDKPLFEPMMVRLPTHIYVTQPQWVNTSKPSASYMRQWIRWALVQIMACHLFGAKPLSKPLLDYSQLDSWEQTLVKF